jgi:hypothetical protein
VLRLRLGAVGVAIEADLGVDVSDATAIRFYFSKPDGTVIDRAGTFSDDGVDGLVRYVTVSGDLSVTGNWQVQVKITTATGLYPSHVLDFEVDSNVWQATP